MRQRYSDQEWAQERRRSAWALVWMIAIPLAFVGVAVWWLESRFGSGVALMVLGGLVGVLALIVGIVLSLAVQRNTLTAAGQFNANLAAVEQQRAQTERARFGVDKERARAERSLTEARARIEVMDVRRVDQIAQQRAQALLQDQRRQQANAPTWHAQGEDLDPNDPAWAGEDGRGPAFGDDDDAPIDGAFRFYE